jgi:hypothetical protein
MKTPSLRRTEILHLHPAIQKKLLHHYYLLQHLLLHLQK